MAKAPTVPRACIALFTYSVLPIDLPVFGLPTAMTLQDGPILDYLAVLREEIRLVAEHQKSYR